MPSIPLSESTLCHSVAYLCTDMCFYTSIDNSSIPECPIKSQQEEVTHAFLSQFPCLLYVLKGSHRKQPFHNHCRQLSFYAIYPKHPPTDLVRWPHWLFQGYVAAYDFLAFLSTNMDWTICMAVSLWCRCEQLYRPHAFFQSNWDTCMHIYGTICVTLYFGKCLVTAILTYLANQPSTTGPLFI